MMAMRPKARFDTNHARQQEARAVQLRGQRGLARESLSHG